MNDAAESEISFGGKYGLVSVLSIIYIDERLKSRGCGQVTYHQEARDPQRACIFCSSAVLDWSIDQPPTGVQSSIKQPSGART
jgi:hypothetical protein